MPGNKHKHTFVSPGSKCRWPQKATRIVLDLVKNAESNAEVRDGTTKGEETCVDLGWTTEGRERFCGIVRVVEQNWAKAGH